MAMAPMKPCAKAGCGTLHRESGAYCATHRPKKRVRAKVDRHEGSASARGYGASWRRTRAAKLRANPLCEACEMAGFVAAANTVHHVDHDQTNNAVENLQSLCRRCHEVIHQRVRG
jgi:5-methylcytosine-specific restriction protein A